MGHYTQIRGWLNVGPVGSIGERLDKAKAEYVNRYPESRSWIYEGTHFPTEMNGFNGESFIFIGVELKNYDDDYRRWLEVLLEFFPEANGRWDVQSEGRYPADWPGDVADSVLTIRIKAGVATEDWTELAWCNM